MKLKTAFPAALAVLAFVVLLCSVASPAPLDRLLRQQPGVSGQLIAGGFVAPWNNSAAAITSPVTVVASGGTNVWYIWAFNTSSSTNYYLEFFNAPSTSVTLGVTKPIAWMVVPYGGGWNPNTPTGVYFQTALSVAAVPALYPNDTAAMPGSTVYATIGAH